MARQPRATAPLTIAGGVVAVATIADWERDLVAVTPPVEIDPGLAEAVTPQTESVTRATDPAAVARLRNAWRDLVLEGGEVTRNYLLHLVDRVEIVDRRVTIVPRLPSVG